MNNNNKDNNNKVVITNQEIRINKSAIFVFPVIFIIAGYFWYKTLTSDSDWIRIGGWVVFLRNLPGLIVMIIILSFMIYYFWHNRANIIWV
jgi:hypothetical protein